ncbi:hypothetical protein BIV57_21915 [Mangrovactinospora gilvigrisea]|uniref:Kinase n=1 Tax=Mangrovactinospora gilvigrisea TaxID=1428644 RepID=A0A1J7B9N9_9ACTN|nr:aminoglycoside phosphotransferase family protein [Mangrovactinospora gilvigrisea]OIV35391.1 hypothetical protein BIV57_21915 [Mangrovactinospora gilvigrisea]
MRGVGDEGRGWLERLPALVEESAARWDLTELDPVRPGGVRSLVLLGTRDGGPVALKLAAPGEPTAAEAAALGRWDGHGAVRLLDRAEDALLLERLRPEQSLRSLPEERAMLEAAEVLRRLWIDPGEGPAGSVPDAAALTDRWTEPLRALPAGLPDGAEAIAAAALEARAELLAAPPETHLLHGDFHQGGVLAGDRQPWTAVGPRPLRGERAFDLAGLALDRLETLLAEPGAQAAVRRRLHRLADALDVDRARLRGWSLFLAAARGAAAWQAGRTERAELLLEFATRLDT